MRAALITALSLNQKEDRIFIVDKLEIPKLSTKAVAACVSAFGLETALIVNVGDGDKEKFFNQSIRNLGKVKCLRPEGVNVFDVLKYKNLVISQKAALKLTERLNHV